MKRSVTVWGEAWKTTKFRLPKRHAPVVTELHKNGLRVGPLCGARGASSIAVNDAAVTCLKCALKIGKTQC